MLIPLRFLEGFEVFQGVFRVLGFFMRVYESGRESMIVHNLWRTLGEGRGAMPPPPMLTGTKKMFCSETPEINNSF